MTSSHRNVFCKNKGSKSRLWLRRLKNTCVEVSFYYSSSIIVQTGNFTKNDLLGKYFAKILTRSTDRLFRRTLLDDYSENIKIYNSLLYLSICFFIIFIDIEEEWQKGGWCNWLFQTVKTIKVVVVLSATIFLVPYE